MGVTRVLQVVSKMNMGGAENFIMNMYRNIDRNLVQFDFITHGKGIFDKEITELGGKIYYLKYINKIGPVLYKKQLKKFFMEHDEYKIIHSHVNQTSGIILETAKKCGVPIRIAHSHSTDTLSNIFIKQYKKILQKKLNLSANIKLACSDDAGRWLYKNSNYEVIRNSIDIERFAFNEEKRKNIRTSLNIKDNEIVLGHVGRLEKVKNHKFLLEMMKKIETVNPNYFLLLIGEGSLKEEINLKIKELNLQNNVKLINNQKNINDFYNAMDVFVLPSLYEGIPLTLIEAICNGLPVYCSNNVDHEFENLENVTYLNIDNPQIWVEKIININNTKQRFKVSKEILERYDVKKEVEKLKNIYLNN